MKPTLAISLGDPAGISPEIVAQMLAHTIDRCLPIVFGHWPSLESALAQDAPGIDILLTETPMPNPSGGISVVHCGPDGPPITKPDQQSALAGLQGLIRAVDAVLADEAQALVTAPVAKHAIATTHPGFTGHTEYLAGRAGLMSDDVTMVFASDALVVGLISTHVPLNRAAEALVPRRIERTTDHLAELLHRLHPEQKPRIGIAAFNPHAGEKGLLGTEEEEILIPCCQALSARKDYEIIGPLPADVLFRDALAGLFHCVVATYHDQAMIPLKLSGVGRMVNVTMGLPFIRTSPDHGVAYDIARTGTANSAGMKMAADLAIKLVKTSST